MKITSNKENSIPHLLLSEKGALQCIRVSFSRDTELLDPEKKIKDYWKIQNLSKMTISG